MRSQGAQPLREIGASFGNDPWFHHPYARLAVPTQKICLVIPSSFTSWVSIWFSGWVSEFHPRVIHFEGIRKRTAQRGEVFCFGRHLVWFWRRRRLRGRQRPASPAEAFCPPPSRPSRPAWARVLQGGLARWREGRGTGGGGGVNLRGGVSCCWLYTLLGC